MFLRLWFSIGVQSFGGGTATFTLIRRTAVEQNEWLTDNEFNNDWALCQITPGINLLGLTILIGRRVAGIPGIIAALLGLLVPSVTITILITAFYAQIKSCPAVQNAFHGIIPACVGLGLVTAHQMSVSPLKASKKEGNGSFALSAALLVFSGLAVALWKLPVVLVLFAAGLVSAFAHWVRSKSKTSESTL